jgi:RNA polymerase sigma-70 factor, ECF subfamily
MEPSAHQITCLLQAWSKGEQSALERLILLFYENSYRPAHYCMAPEQAGHTLQTTALLNAAYLRLIGSKEKLVGA